MKIWTAERTREVLALADELEAVEQHGTLMLANGLRRLAHQLGTTPACEGVIHVLGGTLAVTCDRTDYHAHSFHSANLGDGASIEWPAVSGE